MNMSSFGIENEEFLLSIHFDQGDQKINETTFLNVFEKEKLTKITLIVKASNGSLSPYALMTSVQIADNSAYFLT